MTSHSNHTSVASDVIWCSENSVHGQWFVGER